MAQVSMYNSTAAVWTGNSLILAPRESSLNPNNHYSPSAHLTEKTISSKTTEFINKMSQTFFKETKAPEVKSLNELLQFVSKNGVDPIRDKLTKKTGFLSRIFSNETWKDWLEDKTPIGKVVSLYCERVTHSTRLEALMGRLDKKVLEVANKDAALLLQSLEQPGSTHEKETEEKTTSRSFWSSFLSLPVAEGHVFNAHNFHARNFPANFDVSTLNGSNGFVLNGVIPGVINANDWSGWSVSGAGDINGDGIADLVVGAKDVSSSAGSTYVIFGSSAGWSSPISLSSLNGSNGFVLNGVNANDISGNSVSGAGDINDDGIADLVVGAPGASGTGSTYVIFGSKAGWSSSISLSSLNGSNGFVLNGVNAGDASGFSVSGAGDINGDGIADLVVGAPSTSSNEGSTYVIFGSKVGWSSPISLSSLNGSNGFVLQGQNAQDYSGYSVSGAGDINGDGIADVVVGAYGASGYTGSTYVIFGSTAPWNSPISLSSLNGTNGFVLNDVNAFDEIGFSVSRAGDINGDGIADLIVGAPGASGTYVIFGSKAGWSSPISLSSLNGSNGFVLNGENSDDRSGYSVSGAGDVNSDGISDLIVGAPDFGSGIGKAYVIYGSQGSWSSPISLFNLNGVNGFSIIIDLAESSLGLSVSAAGDVNDDGIADIIIGAPQVSNSVGQTFVIFGQKTVTTTTESTTTTPITTTTTTPTTSTNTTTTSKSSTTTPTTTTSPTTTPTTSTSTTTTSKTSTTTTSTTTTQATATPTTSTSTTPPPTTTTQTTTIPPTTASTTTTTLTPTTTTSTTTTSTTTASTAASTSTTKPTTTTTQRTITTLKTTAPSVGSQMLPDWKITALTVLAVAIAII